MWLIPLTVSNIKSITHKWNFLEDIARYQQPGFDALVNLLSYNWNKSITRDYLDCDTTLSK